MKRDLFSEEHRIFQDSFRAFVQKEIVPYHQQWEEDGIVPRDLWEKAGRQGYLLPNAPEEYGGSGADDFLFSVIVAEELGRAAASGVGFVLQNNIFAPYIMRYANQEQKQRWLPKLISGESIGAIAMTEPSTGSDLAAVQTSAIRHGDHYLVNGAKTFITNGIHSDLVIVVAKTEPSQKHRGMSLVMVERGMEGFERGRNLKKMGMKAQDTAELFFSDVKVPVENLLGEEGQGFEYLRRNLAEERLIVAVGCVATAESALDWTLDYCKKRTAFGKAIGSFQNSRFKLAEMKTEISIGRVFVDQCIQDHRNGNLTSETAAMAKWWCSDLLVRVTYQGTQLHGGYGYMLEYPITRAFADARINPVFAGSNEIMKEIIGRSMGV
ncbi:MAG: acyl-CoA dehydrogenase family protein [SAR324 cluster bacterium]|nr:acyl-CoA dehydrogenase family protein [SAR324 cluster bacterium]